MQHLDETDLEILKLLRSDARRPYRGIAEKVDLSPPAVSDRINRLEDLGIIKEFTVHVDRSQLENNHPVLVQFAVEPASVEKVYDRVRDLEAAEHVHQLFDGRIVATINIPDRDAHAWLRDRVSFEDVVSYDITPIATSEWQPAIRPTDFAIACVVCDNPVTENGEIARVDGDIKAFCCESCHEQYLAEYEHHRSAAES